MSARVKLPESLDKLLRSQLEEAIHEAALHRDDELIARRYLIDKWCQIGYCGGAGMAQGHGGRPPQTYFGTGGKCIRQALHKPYIKRTQPRLGPYPAGEFLCDNIAMEDVRIKGWYTSPPSSRTPLFLYKGRVIYDSSGKAGGRRYPTGLCR